MTGESRSTHLAGLDGLRGIAAVAVMSIHFTAFFLYDTGVPSIAAYLAVDFFLLLSGFVLSAAYSSRLNHGMSAGQFMTARLVRLYPMLLFAIVVAGGLYFLKAILRGVPDDGISPGTFVQTLFLLPAGTFQHWAGQFDAFLFDSPMWSLFFELIGSLLFALGLWRCTGRGSMAVWLALVLVWADVAFEHRTLDGLGVYAPLLFEGFPRFLIPFWLGIFLRHHVPPSRIPQVPFAIPVIGLAGLLFFPIQHRPMFDVASVLLAFPLLLLVAIRSSMSPAVRRACLFLGAISYPLYLMHDPVSRLTAVPAKALTNNPWLIASTGVVASFAVSFLAMRLFDEPVRRWLTSKLRAKALVSVRPVESAETLP